MNLTTEILIAVLVVGSMLLQFGDHRLSIIRLLLPLGIVAWAATTYLKGIPTDGGDLGFELIGLASGIALGVIAAALMGVRREGQGAIILRAGIAYATLWIIVFGARLVFAWFATNSAGFHHQLGVFSYQHQITSSEAWTAFFILQAVAMVLVRSLVVGVRILTGSRRVALQPAA